MSDRLQNLVPNDGVAWPTLFGVTAGIDDMQVRVDGGNGKYYCEAVYTGSGAITLTNYNGFPVGSRIFNVQAATISMKTAATTWVTSAAMT